MGLLRYPEIIQTHSRLCVQGRLDELVRVYGSNRLMWGSDFPYVQTMGGGYVEAPRAVLNWHKQGLLPSMQSQDFENLFAGTVLRVLPE